MISSVTTIAKTPSLNASKRPVPSTSGRASWGLCSGPWVTEASVTGRRWPRRHRSRRQIRAGHAARLLALRPVELLVDLVLGVAALEQRRLGGQDHVRVAADVGDRVGGRQAELVQDGAQDRLDPPCPARPVLVARVVGPRDGRDVGDRIGPGALPLVEDAAIAELVGVRDAVQEDDGPRPAIDQELAHHRHERRIARPRRDEDVGPLVVGLEHELALRADHPHRWPTGRRHSSGVNVPPSTRRT